MLPGCQAHYKASCRCQVLGRRDKVVFYHEGLPDIPFSHLYTIMQLLSHMSILALFDEFQEQTNGNIAKFYKVSTSVGKADESLYRKFCRRCLHCDSLRQCMT